MKIALVCRAYPTHRPGGMPYVCQDRARALAALGHDVQVWTTGHRGRRTVDDCGVAVKHLRCPDQSYTPQFAAACLTQNRRWCPEIVHLDSFDRDRSWWSDLSCRVAITMHGLGPGEFLTEWNLWLAKGGAAPTLPAKSFRIERNGLAKADVVIAISRHEAWQLQDLYALSNVVRVPNPIADVFFETEVKPVPEGAPWVVVGNPGTSPNRRFDLAEKAAAQAGVKFKRLTGKTLRECMPEIYDRCMGLLLPTFWSQGYDLTVAEALARGRPVIVSATGSYYWEDEPGMIKVPRGDVSAMAQAIKEAPGALQQNKKHCPKRHAEQWLEAVT